MLKTGRGSRRPSGGSAAAPARGARSARGWTGRAAAAARSSSC